MKVVAFEICLKELLVFSMRMGMKSLLIVCGEMKKQENLLVDPCWFSWIRVNQRETMEYKTGKGLEQMWLVIDCRKERIRGFSYESVSCSVVFYSLRPRVL